MGKTLHPPAPPKNFLPQTLIKRLLTVLRLAINLDKAMSGL
ncbi:hypothetical protein MICAC_6020004 [Microcystis aeruginosa PCC 9443]|uniref:Uncharacterized protein n=1 Tax=Microcystis aeruginosa PCC 9443 TaxID=1160281 RepID=I4GA92_MICAE|nr:hypothetical protein MICAC_6020004 [Microcystis aeruginosa PCC 9443]